MERHGDFIRSLRQFLRSRFFLDHDFPPEMHAGQIHPLPIEARLRPAISLIRCLHLAQSHPELMNGRLLCSRNRASSRGCSSNTPFMIRAQSSFPAGLQPHAERDDGQVVQTLCSGHSNPPCRILCSLPWLPIQGIRRSLIYKKNRPRRAGESSRVRTETRGGIDGSALPKGGVCSTSARGHPPRPAWGGCGRRN